jgi:hypothetical protein
VKRFALFFGTAALAVGAAGASSAQGILDQLFGGYGQQGQRGGATITLFSEPGFRGEARTIYEVEANLVRIGFNDRARSIQTNRPIIVCEDIEFRGRCERINGPVADLNYSGLGGRVSSVRIDDGRGGGYGGGYPGGGYPGGGYGDDDYGSGGGYGRPGRGYGRAARDGVEGRSAVFFVRPTVDGRPLAARGQGSADQFCRASGLQGAIYYSQGERVRDAVDTDGRVVDAPVLRDVLCRR